MERFIRWFGFSMVAILLSAPGRAGVSLVAVPAQQEEGSDDGFPVSTFGQPPSNPVLHAADQPARVNYGDRAPAGLVVGGGSSAGAREAAEADRVNPPPQSRAQKPMAELPPVELIPNKTKGIQEVALIAGDLGYFPKTFFVTRDVPVRLFVTGASRKPLCFMMDSFQVRRQVSAQKIEEITFVPNVPGQYRFYCPMNGMEGTMVVRELSSTPTLAQE